MDLHILTRNKKIFRTVTEAFVTVPWAALAQGSRDCFHACGRSGAAWPCQVNQQSRSIHKKISWPVRSQQPWHLYLLGCFLPRSRHALQDRRLCWLSFPCGIATGICTSVVCKKLVFSVWTACDERRRLPAFASPESSGAERCAFLRTHRTLQLEMWYGMFAATLTTRVALWC